ncbi:GNAT family N-acetyltransferase [Longibacter sp.]|jgi:ribosomal protein S18 acetylase RimI-like enzyme|uniref:GNAT family N-acetyltransferase n=1 Tax=Longibacter sp. TaxID=2045415 RepID=UPI003EBBB998
MSTLPYTIRPAIDGDWAAVRDLFRDYLSELDFDLDFQDVDRELRALPGPYASPDGAVLLALESGASGTRHTGNGHRAVGVVAIKPLDAENGTRICEMKRLFVRPGHRGRGLGRALAEAIVEAARRRDYDMMRLDTVASMSSARAVYDRLGFRERDPYYHNPLDDVVYYERHL